MKNITIIMITAMFLFGTITTTANEWFFEVNPSKIRMYSSNRLEKASWFKETYGVQNFVNLSFFTSKTFIPPYKDSIRSVETNKKQWPVFVIDTTGTPCIYRSSEFKQITGNNVKFSASGYPILLENGKKVKIYNSYFSKRRCARTAVGIHPNGSVIIYVNTSATLKDVQKFFWTIGCVDAINFDGGSSTFLILNGKKMYSSNKGHSYPNVLSWE